MSLVIFANCRADKSSHEQNAPALTPCSRVIEFFIEFSSQICQYYSWTIREIYVYDRYSD